MTATLESPVPSAKSPPDTSHLAPDTLAWTPHPLIDRIEAGRFRRLTDEEIDDPAFASEDITAHWRRREQRIKLAKVDPLRHGFDLPHWPMLWHYLLLYWEMFNFGGNDSAKTTFMGKTINKLLDGSLVIPGAMEGAPQICCIAQNETMSKRVQQKKVYEFLPLGLRQLNDSSAPKQRRASQKISYSDDGGFTNGSFSVANPRGAAVLFRNVTQFERNELALEGDGFHLIPVDESCPIALLDVLRFRAAKKRGRIPYCFTPVKGFDAVCANVLRGARVISYLPMQWDWTYGPSNHRGTEDRSAAVAAEMHGQANAFEAERQPESLKSRLESDKQNEGSTQQGDRAPSSVPPCLCGYSGTYRADGQFVPKGAEAIGQFLTGGINPEIQFPELDLDYTDGKGNGYVAGVPPGHMPVVMKPLNQKAIVVFSWSHWNPFAPRSDFNPHLPAIADRCVGRGAPVALMRLFGYTKEMAGAILSNFKADYYPNGHLIRHAELLEMARLTPHNLRCGADPATRRSWFIGWKLVFPDGVDGRPMQYLGWESPARDDGEWVTPEGEKGEAQRRFPGGDVDFYKILIREQEAKIAREIYGGHVPKDYVGEGTAFDPDPVLRKGDAKGFASPSLGTPEQNLFELFYRDDSAKDPRLSPMFFQPARVRATVVDDVGGEGKLIDLLACDWTKPIDANNHPHLLVSDQCLNTITSWLNWDGKKQNLDGKVVNSPHADPVDMGRILFDEEISYSNPAHSNVRSEEQVLREYYQSKG